MKYIFSFGCPRSGTTYLQKSILIGLQGSHVHYRKIPEWHGTHPCVSNNGLVSLQLLLDNVLFIRIVRNPIDIMESFYATKQEKYKDLNFVKNDRVFLQLIINEEHNFKLQLRNINWRCQQGKTKVLVLPYEKINTEHYSKLLVKTVNAHIGFEAKDKAIEQLNTESMLKGISNFRKKANNHGKLELGITKSLIPEDKKKEYTEFFKEFLPNRIIWPPKITDKVK